ncbi:tetratricopeptide repeat protein [Kitasatospora cinereorecta]
MAPTLPQPTASGEPPRSARAWATGSPPRTPPAGWGTCWCDKALRAEGRRLLARTLWVYREFGNLWGEAATLYALAEAQLAAGRAASACRRAEAAVRLWREIGSRTWLAVGLDTLARAHTMAGDLTAAARAQGEASAVRAVSEAWGPSGADRIRRLPQRDH